MPPLDRIVTRLTTAHDVPTRHAGTITPPSADSTPRPATSPQRPTRLAETERQLDRATDYLERTRARTAPSVDRYDAAWVEREDARRDLSHHDTASQLDLLLDPARHAQRRVDALETWERWANGNPVSDTRVRETLGTLSNDAANGYERISSLSNVLEDWATLRGIKHPERSGPQPAPDLPGLEIEI